MVKIDIKGCQIKRMYPLGYKVRLPRGSGQEEAIHAACCFRRSVAFRLVCLGRRVSTTCCGWSALLEAVPHARRGRKEVSLQLVNRVSLLVVLCLGHERAALRKHPHQT